MWEGASRTAPPTFDLHLRPGYLAGLTNRNVIWSDSPIATYLALSCSPNEGQHGIRRSGLAEHRCLGVELDHVCLGLARRVGGEFVFQVLFGRARIGDAGMWPIQGDHTLSKDDLTKRSKPIAIIGLLRL